MALFHRALQVTVVYIPFNIHSNHWVYFKIELATNTITLHDPLPPLLQTQMKNKKQFLHRLAEWVIQVKRKRTINAHLALLTVQAFPVLFEPATSFRTVTSITQKDGFQCEVICIGNIMADASNKPGRVRSRYCENIRKYIGLLLWLNSQRPIALSQDHMSLLAQYSPSVTLLLNLPPGEVSLNPLVSPLCHGDASDSDSQIQEGPEPDSSTVLASDGLGQPRGTKPARSGEVETLQPSSIRPWRDLEWQKTLQVGKGLNNLNHTWFKLLRPLPTCRVFCHSKSRSGPLTNERPLDLKRFAMQSYNA